MAHNVSGASLDGIFSKLNETDGYHPLDAQTFADWSMEAGDVVNVSRGEQTYSSPVNNVRMVWKGAPQTTISSTGTKEREAVSKVSRKKYGRGGSAVRAQEHIYREFHSEDGYLHSYIEMTESYLRTEFTDDMNSLRGDFEVTASHLRADFEDDINSLRGDFEVTASHLRADFEDDINSLRGDFEVTASHLRSDFEDDINSLRGEFEVTASHLRADFEDDINSLRGDFEVTASHLRSDFEDDINSLRGDFEVTASHLRADFEDDINSLRGDFEVTASHLRSDFEDDINSLRGEFEVTASHLRADFEDDINSLRGDFEVTASHLRSDFEDDINSLRGDFEVTASHLRSDFEDDINSLRGDFEVTASHLRSDFEDDINSLRGDFEVTASHLRSDFEDDINSLRGDFEVTASGLRSEFEDEINSVSSRITQQANRIGLVVEGTGANAHIKAAQIVAAINDDGTSETLISADKILLDGNTTVAGLLSVEDGGLRVNGTAFFHGDITMASGTEIFAGDIRATEIRFPGVNPGDDRTLTLSDVTGMIVDAEVDTSTNTLKLWKKGDPASSPSITFSKATSINSLTGSWSGSASPGMTMTVVTNPSTGKEYTISFSSQTANQKLSVDVDRTRDPEQITGTTNIRVPIHVYTPGTGQYDPAVDRWTGTAALNVSSLLEDKTGTNKITANGTYSPGSAYMGFSAVEIDVPSSTTTPVLTGGWNGRTFTVSSTPAAVANKGTTISSKHSYDSSIDVHYIDIDAQDTDAQSAVTRAKYVLALSTGSVSSGSRTIKVQYNGSDTGLSYVCPDYGNGQNAVTLNNAAWQYDGDNVVANNRNTNTVSVTTAGRPTQLTKSETVYLDTSSSWSGNTKSIYVRRSNSHGEYVAVGSVTAPSISVSGWSLGTFTAPYSYKPSVTVNGTTYTSGSNLNATGAYNSGWTAGQSTSSGGQLELYRTPTGNIAFGTTYTIKAKAYSSNSATAKTDISGASLSITVPALSLSNWSLGTFTAPYSYKPSVTVNGTTYTSGSNLNATDAYDAGWTKGLEGVELYRTPSGSITYGTTYTINAKAYISRSATAKTDISGASISITTPADRYSDGQKSVTPTLRWVSGTGFVATNPYDATKSSTLQLSSTYAAPGTAASDQNHYIKTGYKSPNDQGYANALLKVIALNTGSTPSGASGSRTITVKYDGSNTQLNYVCPDYGNGYTAGRLVVTPTLRWVSGTGFVATNPYDATKSSTLQLSSTYAAPGTATSDQNHYIKTGYKAPNDQGYANALLKIISLDTGTSPSGASGSRTITFKFDGSNTQLNYVCQDYGNGYTAGRLVVTPTLRWVSGTGFVATNPYDATKSSTLQLSSTYAAPGTAASDQNHYIKTGYKSPNDQGYANALLKVIALNTGSTPSGASGSRTITVKYDGSNTQLNYVCPDYGNGYTAGRLVVTPTLRWVSGTGFVATNPYDATKSSTLQIDSGFSTDSDGSGTKYYLWTGYKAPGDHGYADATKYIVKLGLSGSTVQIKMNNGVVWPSSPTATISHRFNSKPPTTGATNVPCIESTLYSYSDSDSTKVAYTTFYTLGFDEDPPYSRNTWVVMKNYSTGSRITNTPYQTMRDYYDAVYNTNHNFVLMGPNDSSGKATFYGSSTTISAGSSVTVWPAFRKYGVAAGNTDPNNYVYSPSFTFTAQSSSNYNLNSVTANNDWPQTEPIDSFFGPNAFTGTQYITFPASATQRRRYIRFKIGTRSYLIYQ